MGWTKIGLLLLILIFVFVVNYFGNYFGYTVDGVPAGGAIEGTPSLWDLSFMWDLMSFQIDGVPEWVGMIFIVINLLALYILVSTVLPGGG